MSEAEQWQDKLSKLGCNTFSQKVKAFFNLPLTEWSDTSIEFSMNSQKTRGNQMFE
jgi:hypothetical protein